MASNESWAKIFADYNIADHNFDLTPFQVTAAMIKRSCQDFRQTTQKEVRILCSQPTRDSRPQVFAERDLFLLPIKNGTYIIVRGEGYLDLAEIAGEAILKPSKLEFDLETSRVGSSEMQHVDFAYASSVIRTFVEDDSLVLTIRGRKRTPDFTFFVGNQEIDVSSVQTEVDAGYEGRDKVVLVEAKNSTQPNTIIRQLYYPYRQWQSYTDKKVLTVFFEREDNGAYHLWLYEFTELNDYNSINLVKSAKYKVIH